MRKSPPRRRVEFVLRVGDQPEVAERRAAFLGRVGQGLSANSDVPASRDHAVDRALPNRSIAACTSATACDFDVLRLEAVDELLSPRSARFEARATFRWESGRRTAEIARRNRSRAIVAGDRLGQERDGARLEGPLSRLVGRDDAHGDVPQSDVALQPFQHAPAVDVGQVEIERDGVRLILPHQRQARRAQRRHQAFHSFVAGRFEQEPRKAFVVLDDQHDLVARLDVVAVVARFVDELVAVRSLVRSSGSSGTAWAVPLAGCAARPLLADRGGTGLERSRRRAGYAMPVRRAGLLRRRLAGGTGRSELRSAGTG